MSVLDIPLRKILSLFYAREARRRSILRQDILLDRKKEAGGTRSQGGDFFLGFWSDVKTHISGDGDLSQLTLARVANNPRCKRLYPLLKDGVLDLLNEKLRWSNEPVEIVPRSASGDLFIDELAATVRVRGAIYAIIREKYARVVYPYFSEEPALSEEAGRLGIWAMQQALPDLSASEMRIIDPLRRTFFSPETTPLHGDERAIFVEKYISVIREWERLKLE